LAVTPLAFSFQPETEVERRLKIAPHRLNLETIIRFDGIQNFLPTWPGNLIG
jgi:hypothetical protein